MYILLVVTSVLLFCFVFQICQFIDEILDNVYLHADLSLEHQSAVPLQCDNTSHDCDTSVHSYVSDHEATNTNLLSVNDGNESGMHFPSHPSAHSSAHSDTVLTSPSHRPPSQVHNLLNSLHSLPVNDLVSQLHIHLAPLSDFLTQHLALLQTWLSCGSYGHLVALLCQHIAQVDSPLIDVQAFRNVFSHV